MVKKLSIVTMLFCTATYAAAATIAIGTASARGDLRVDGYMVKGDATLFDGTVVQTGQASAALHLEKGVEIKLAIGSRGILYRNRLVLEQGASEWTGSGSFLLEANGLHVTPSEPNSRGQISIGSRNTVQVTAATGGLRVTNEHGLLLASVHPGSPLSFGALQETTQGPIPMNLFGTLTKAEGRYYLALPKPDLGVVYEVKSEKGLDNLVSKKVEIAGTVDTSVKAAGGNASYVLVASSVKEIRPGGLSMPAKVILGTTGLGAATAVSTGIYAANQSATPASR